MTLVTGPSGNLLYGPGGLANSTKCCCCEQECAACPCCFCRVCGDGLEYSLPTGGCSCGLATKKSCIVVTLSGLTLSTACRTYRGSDCSALPGTFASYKLNASSMADLELPFCYETDPGHADIPDPDSICDDLLNVCDHWEMCVSLPDTGITFTQYANANCTGSSNTAALRIAGAWLRYQVVGTTRRWVLYVTAFVGSAIPIPIFLGVVNFDARQCSNYSAWPLVVPNGIAGISCVCGASGEGKHTLATGGTGTMALTCTNPNCDGSESLMGDGESMAMEALRGDVAGASASIAQQQKKGCCL